MIFKRIAQWNNRKHDRCDLCWKGSENPHFWHISINQYLPTMIICVCVDCHQSMTNNKDIDSIIFGFGMLVIDTLQRNLQQPQFDKVWGIDNES
jgi:hypothetical protein